MAKNGIISDTFTPALNTTRTALRPSGKKSIMKKINIQWKANNARRFNSQEAAEENGNIKQWDGYKSSSIRNKNGTFKKRHSAYYTSTGQKKRTPSNIRYTGKRSELNRDTGRLRLSVGARGNKADIDTVTSRYMELGSKVPYAAYQHKMRRLVSISAKDRTAFKRIFLKGIGIRK